MKDFPFRIELTKGDSMFRGPCEGTISLRALGDLVPTFVRVVEADWHLEIQTDRHLVEPSRFFENYEPGDSTVTFTLTGKIRRPPPTPAPTAPGSASPAARTSAPTGEAAARVPGGS